MPRAAAAANLHATVKVAGGFCGLHNPACSPHVKTELKVGKR
jgi:hypothetical protein